MRAVAVSFPFLLVGLVACGSDETESDPKDALGGVRSEAPTNLPTPSVSASGDDAERMADVLQADIPVLSGRIEMTEGDDSNELFGRPGKYDQVTFLGDTRLGCSAADDYNGFDTQCGVKIERWPSADAAQARAEDIQAKLQEYGLGAEWDYVVGRLVVRASGDYKPSQASRIQEAAAAGAPVAPK